MNQSIITGPFCFVLCLQACAKTCDFVYSQLAFIQESLDGKNLESVLTEFGTRIHRQLFEHLQQFQYTSIGKQCLFYNVFPCCIFISFLLFVLFSGREPSSACVGVDKVTKVLSVVANKPSSVFLYSVLSPLEATSKRNSILCVKV